VQTRLLFKAYTKSIAYGLRRQEVHSIQTHTFWTTLNTNKTERFTTALEAESPVSNEISDFTPFAHE